MKKLLFRGMCTHTNEWHYGGIVHQTDYYGNKVDDYYIIEGDTTEDNNIGYSYKVRPETVGQYTGLRDCNNRRIYEGDILESPIRSLHDKHGVRIIVRDIRECRSIALCASEYEVVGNMTENPELVREKAK